MTCQASAERPLRYKETEESLEPLSGIEDRIFARGQEAGKRATVKELFALGDLSLEKIFKVSGFSIENLKRIQASLIHRNAGVPE